GDGPMFAREHYQMLAEEAAGRLIRKEVAALTRLYERHKAQNDWQGWEQAVGEFYMTHAELVAQTMRIPKETAVAYCWVQAKAAASGGLEEMADWETRRVVDLVRLATGAEQ
ncbi:MAG: hypothetical protein KC425_18530, partial [Anaerolineales bacterium]|nr:hypothetical protein [Anaerolineales bacterium]